MNRTEKLLALSDALDSIYDFLEPLVPADVVPAPEPVPAPPKPVQKVAAVSYFYPGVRWDTLVASKPAFAIINPASGPGPTKSAAYADQVLKAQDGGVKVLGYLTANYMDLHGAQGDGVDRLTTAGPLGEMLKYLAFYPTLDGFFVDEQEISGSVASLAYSQELFDLANARGKVLVSNPGTKCPEAYASRSHVLMNFEGTAASYRARVALPWEAKHPPDKFWHCVHDVVAAEVPELVSLAKVRRAGYLYLGEASYGKLPTFWDALVKAVAA